MSSLRATFLVLSVVSSVFFAGGCGGGRPGKLKHHFAEMHIAAVPQEEKETVIQAQQEFYAAELERANAETKHREAATDITVAKNERDQAILDEKSADAKKKSADASNDINRINAAALWARAAKLARRAGDKKVEFMEARRTYLKKYMEHAEDMMYAKEASYELSKAKLAQNKGIRPEGFDLAHYQEQAQKRAEIAKKSREKLAKEKTALDAKEKEWKELDRDAKRAKVGGGGGDSSGTSTTEDSSESAPAENNQDSE